MSLQKNKKDLVINGDEDNQVEEKKKKEFSLGEGIGKANQGILNPV